MKKAHVLIATSLLALVALWALPAREQDPDGTTVSAPSHAPASAAPELDEDWEPQVAAPIVPVMPEEMPDPLRPAPGSEALLDEHNQPELEDLSRAPELDVDPERGRARTPPQH